MYLSLSSLSNLRLILTLELLQIQIYLVSSIKAFDRRNRSGTSTKHAHSLVMCHPIKSSFFNHFTYCLSIHIKRM